MTILIIALSIISFNVNAQFKANINPNKQGIAGYSLKEDTKEALDKKLMKLLSKAKWLKGEWNKEESGSILSKIEIENEMVDTGETEMVPNDDGTETEVPVKEVVEKEVTYYYHPSNFTYAFKDITAEEQAEINKKADRKVKINKAKGEKGSLDKGKDESVAEWRTRIAGIIEILLEELKE